MARRQTGSEFAEQLGRPGGNHEHARGVGVRRGAVARHGLLACRDQVLESIHISAVAGMGAGHLYKNRLSSRHRSGLGRASVLPQRGGLKQHTAGIKGGSQVLAHRRLLASEQHDNLSPVARHGRQQLEQAMRKRRDTAHTYGAGARRKVVCQHLGHKVSRLAGLDHVSTLQAARIGAQQLKHAGLGVTFGLGPSGGIAAAFVARPRHARQHVTGHTREHAYRALAARERLQSSVVAAVDHVREQHLALKVVHKAAAIAHKLPQRAEPRCGRLVVDTQRNPSFCRIMTTQVELGKCWRQQNSAPVAGNQVGQQRRLGTAQIRAGISGKDPNRHGPPLKLFAIFNASILPARTDNLTPMHQIPSMIRFPPSPRDRFRHTKTAPEGAAPADSFVAVGLLAILQLDEDLAIATVLAVERLGNTTHRGGRSARAGLNLNIGLALIQITRDLQALRKIANLARRADIG